MHLPTLARLSALFLILNLANASADEIPLSALPNGADPAAITVSGVSSGAAMAIQLHVALSSQVRGVAAFAGFVYGCGQGNYQTLRRCARPQQDDDTPLERLLNETRRRAENGAIDPLANLAKSRVYLFAGSNDTLIQPIVSQHIKSFYQRLMPKAEAGSIVLNENPLANHAWISPDATQACSEYGGNWINNCGSDPQAEFLTLFYGPLQKRASAPLAGQLIRFAQAPLAEGDAAARGLADEGFAFIPPGCSGKDNACRVHLALHGCMMSQSSIGEQFVRLSGLNPWADNNRIIVVYPQALPSTNNPRACWDIWGIHDPAYDTKAGGQIRFVHNLLNSLTGSAATAKP